MVKEFKKKRCLGCGKEDFLISSFLGVCRDCIIENFENVKNIIYRAHQSSREEFDLPPHFPRTKKAEAVVCNLCAIKCELSQGEKSFCGLRENKNGKLKGASMLEGYLAWYYDNLPTNCVADWVCPGGTGEGYPHFSHTKGPEYGYKNLAVFYYGCSFNCLFCQNWHWRENIKKIKPISPAELLEAIDTHTSCICFFGGDPSSQITHSLKVAELAREKFKGKILRICWETNGCMSERFLDRMAKISLESGGCIKFDLKAFNENMNIALCGVSNRKTLENFRYLSSFFKKRKEPPLLVASTLLVPGYITEEEVAQIARFIASLDPSIPYTLLAFHPHFYLHDLPTTSRNHARNCFKIAKEAGLERVKIGNIHLLSDAY
ncbi:radical SAM protein, partial [Candidatus Aerophobetes bacterium]|nr:radical SAM protein [Candidatus Aerophobetes bacterium]